MKTILNLSLALLAAVLFAGCSEPDDPSPQYKDCIEQAVGVMDTKGFYAKGTNWTVAKRDALEATPGNETDAHEVIKKALRVAGGRHSKLLETGEYVPGSGRGQFTLPTVSVTDEGAWLITLPAFDGNEEQATAYAKTVLDALPETVPAVIIDLLQAQGENPYPMLAAIHRFLPEGTVLRVHSREGFATLTAENMVSKVGGIEVGKRIHCPVALLTGTSTRGAGEAVVLSFTTHDYCRRIGTRTAGYAAVNQAFPLSDGSQLWLTTGNYATTQGFEPGEEPISPNVNTATPLVTANLWMKEIFPSPKEYVTTAIDYMNQYGLYAEGATWEAARAEALAGTPATLTEAHDIIRKALSVAGGKHSQLWTLEASEHIKKTYFQDKPSVTTITGGIVVVKLPGFMGNDEEKTAYASAVTKLLPTQAPGIIIDLRENNGGSMYPMMAAVHQLLPTDILLTFRGRDGDNVITMPYVLRATGISALPPIQCPAVAILTSEKTASAAEATLLSFRGLPYTRTFGKATAGYASGNITIILSDGAKMLLTTGRDVARTGEEFCDDPIEPDATTAQPMEDAINWIQQQNAP